MAGKSREVRRSRLRTDTGISEAGSRAHLRGEVKVTVHDWIGLDDVAVVQISRLGHVTLHGGRTP